MRLRSYLSRPVQAKYHVIDKPSFEHHVNMIFFFTIIIFQRFSIRDCSFSALSRHYNIFLHDIVV